MRVKRLENDKFSIELTPEYLQEKGIPLDLSSVISGPQIMEYIGAILRDAGEQLGVSLDFPMALEIVGSFNSLYILGTIPPGVPTKSLDGLKNGPSFSDFATDDDDYDLGVHTLADPSHLFPCSETANSDTLEFAVYEESDEEDEENPIIFGPPVIPLAVVPTPEAPMSNFHGGKKSPKKVLIYSFSDFELLIQLAPRLAGLQFTGGSVHHYRGQYHLRLTAPSSLDSKTSNNLLGLLEEYGNLSTATLAMLQEYGKPVYTELAIHHLVSRFS